MNRFSLARLENHLISLGMEERHIPWIKRFTLIGAGLYFLLTATYFVVTDSGPPFVVWFLGLITAGILSAGFYGGFDQLQIIGRRVMQEPSTCAGNISILLQLTITWTAVTWVCWAFVLPEEQKDWMVVVTKGLGVPLGLFIVALLAYDKRSKTDWIKRYKIRSGEVKFFENYGPDTTSATKHAKIENAEFEVIRSINWVWVNITLMLLFVLTVWVIALLAESANSVLLSWLGLISLSVALFSIFIGAGRQIWIFHNMIKANEAPDTLSLVGTFVGMWGIGSQLLYSLAKWYYLGFGSAWMILFASVCGWTTTFILWRQLTHFKRMEKVSS